ncbi:MAG: GldG family protein [bacterium]|nr:GldG family protein [bacterium]
MKLVRTITGLGALLGIAAAINILLLTEDFFVPWVLAPLGLGVAFGAVWLIVSLILAVSMAEESRSLEPLNMVIGSLAFLGICIALYAFAKRIDWSWDLTQEGRRELAHQTVQVLEQLDKDVEILVLFLNTGDRENDIAKEKTVRFLERCQEHTPYLSLVFMDPQKDIARLQAMKVTYTSRLGSLVLRCGGASRAVSLAGNPARLEETDFTNTLINLTRGATPKVCFLTGHGERNDTRMFRQLLQAESYRAEDFAITTENPRIPADCDILCINRLEANMSGPEIDAIHRYMSDGGRMLALLDVTAVQGGGPMPRMAFLSWLESRYGIIVGDDVLISTVSDRFGVIDLLPDTAAVNLFGQEDVPDVEFLGCFSADHKISSNFNQQMSLMLARSVELAPEMPEGTVGTRILRTLPYTWAEKRLEFLTVATAARPEQDPDELVGSIGVAAAVTARTSVPVGDTGRTRDARIVVMGDTDITADDSVLNSGHLNFLLNATAWLCEHEELIGIRPNQAQQPIRLTESAEQVVAWVAILGVLQAVVVAGLVAHALRRKYQ